MQGLKIHESYLSPCQRSSEKKNENHYWKFSLMNQWNNIMGTFANKVAIAKIANNQITIAVCDTSWMQELHLLSIRVKDKINQTLGTNKIEVIKFKYDPNCKMQKTTNKKSNLINPKKTVHMLSNNESQAIAKIADQELAQALLGFLQKCHQFS